MKIISFLHQGTQSKLSPKPLSPGGKSTFDSITNFYVVSFSFNDHTDCTTGLTEKTASTTNMCPSGRAKLIAFL
jgi:hypothetical protein